MRRIWWIVGLNILVLGCNQPGGGGAGGKDGPPKDGAPLKIAVALPPYSFLAEKIGGPGIEVAVLLRPGENHETFQPSDREITALMRCRIYFQIGMSFEEPGIMKAIGSTQGRIKLVDLRKGIALRKMEGPGCSHGGLGHAGGACSHGPAESSLAGKTGQAPEGYNHSLHGLDPHIWLAPGLLKIQAGTMAEALAEADPGRAEVYRRNLEALGLELDHLDASIRALLAPHRGRALFFFHPAWGYFCDAYGLRQEAVEVEGKEPSEAELTAFLNRARKEGIKAVFVQPQIEGASTRVLAKVLCVPVRWVDPLARDPLENLGLAAREFFGALSP